MNKTYSYMFHLNVFLVFTTILICTKFETVYAQNSAQSPLVTDYLISFNKPKMPEIYLPEMGSFKTDYHITSSYKRHIKFKKGFADLTINKYQLGRSVFFEMGKGKCGKDSLFYFNMVKYKSVIYKIKKSFNLNVIGYNMFKKYCSVCYKLEDGNNHLLFTLDFGHNYAFNITQYDFLKQN